MIKRFVLLLMFCLLLCLPIPATTAGKQDSTVDQPNREPLRIKFIGGSPNGTWYMVMNGVTECINRSYPGSIVTVVPGAGLANVTRIQEKQGDCALSCNTFCSWAFTGEEPFVDKLTNISSIACLYPSYYQFVVSKKSGVKSIKEICEKKLKLRLSVDQPGSAVDITTKRLFKEYGFTFDDLKKWGGDIIYKNMDTSSQMLTEGLIDGFCTATLYSAPSLQEASINTELLLIPIEPKIAKILSRKYGYSKGIIPANAYSFNKKEVPTFCSFNIVIIPKDAPDEISYKVARSIYENLDYLRSVHVALKQMTPESLTQNLGVSMHGGALKFYKEIGVIK